MFERTAEYFRALVWALPDAMALLVVVVLLSAFVLIRSIARRSDLNDSDDRLTVLLGGCIAGLIAATSLTIPNPRYVVLVVPLAVAAAWPVLSRIGVPRSARLFIVVVWISLNLVNQSGRLYPARSFASDPSRLPRMELLRLYMARERSREITQEILAAQDVVQFIAREHPDAIVLTRPPYAHMLALPFLGFVEQPVAGFCEHLGADLTFPMCGFDGLLNLPDLNQSILAQQPVLVLYDFTDDSPGTLPRTFDPQSGPRFDDKRVYHSDWATVWMLDPKRTRSALTHERDRP